MTDVSRGFDRTILEYRHVVPVEPNAWLAASITPELLSEDDDGCE